MIGIVVVTHGNIGIEMVRTVKQIMPDNDNIVAVTVESDRPPDIIREDISQALSKVKNPNGTLILTDMFGGTPSNICLSFLNQPDIEVVSGINLPMLIKLANLKQNTNLKETVKFIQEYGQKNIVVASQILSNYQPKK